MPIRITALIENTASKEGVIPQHGLSLYIEAAGRHILFDMGQDDLFLRNAQALGVDVRRVDAAVLSHGHYDHGGGLSFFLQANTDAPVYVSRYAFEEHRNKEGKDIGLSPALSGCERLTFTEEVYEIGAGLTLYSCNGRVRRHPIDTGGMTACGRAEDFRHEQYLLIEAEGKRVLISGCSHKGILNLAEWFRPDVLVGGFHLSKWPCDEKLTAVARQLAAFDTTYVTCHCTGVEQYEWMRSSLPRLTYLAAGDTIVI